MTIALGKPFNLTEEVRQILVEYEAWRVYESGVWAAVAEMGPGQGRLIVGEDIGTVEQGYTHAYCYAGVAQAIAVLKDWDGTGEPQGWYRSPTSGRRRPGGDPAKEYINW